MRVTEFKYKLCCVGDATTDVNLERLYYEPRDKNHSSGGARTQCRPTYILFAIVAPKSQRNPLFRGEQYSSSLKANQKCLKRCFSMNSGVLLVLYCYTEETSIDTGAQARFMNQLPPGC